jgi:hypothetical protein
MKTFFYSTLIAILILAGAQLCLAEIPIPLGNTSIPVPWMAISSSDHVTRKTDASSITCSRVKNGTQASCAGSSAEISDANNPGEWKYTPGSGDVDTQGTVTFTFSASGMDTVSTAIFVGAQDANSTQWKGGTIPSPVTTGEPIVTVADGGIGPKAVSFDGTLVSKSGTVLGLASGAIDADNQFTDGVAVALYDTNGILEERTCITASSNSADTVTTFKDISALVTVGDYYTLQADSGCTSLRPTTPGRTLDVASGGEAGVDLSNVNGTLDAGEIGANAFASAKFASDYYASINTEADTALSDYGALKPTTAGRTLDVAATGEAGVDLGNVAGTLDAGEIGSNAFAAAKFASDFYAAVNTEADTALSDYGALRPSTTGRTLDVSAAHKAGIDLDNTAGTLGSSEFGTGFLTDDGIDSTAGNKIADHVLRRNNANVEASSDGDTLDFQSLYGAVAKQTNNIAVSGTSLIIKAADGSTNFKTQTVTTSTGAAPVTGLAN